MGRVRTNWTGAAGRRRGSGSGGAIRLVTSGARRSLAACGGRGMTGFGWCAEILCLPRVGCCVPLWQCLGRTDDRAAFSLRWRAWVGSGLGVAAATGDAVFGAVLDMVPSRTPPTGRPRGGCHPSADGAVVSLLRSPTSTATASSRETPAFRTWLSPNDQQSDQSPSASEGDTRRSPGAEARGEHCITRVEAAPHPTAPSPRQIVPWPGWLCRWGDGRGDEL